MPGRGFPLVVFLCLPFCAFFICALHVVFVRPIIITSCLSNCDFVMVYCKEAHFGIYLLTRVRSKNRPHHKCRTPDSASPSSVSGRPCAPGTSQRSRPVATTASTKSSPRSACKSRGCALSPTAKPASPPSPHRHPSVAWPQSGCRIASTNLCVRA